MANRDFTEPTTGGGMGGTAGATPSAMPGASTQPGAGNEPGVMNKASEKAHELVGEARQQASQRMESGLTRGKSQAASTLGSIAHSLQATSRQLNDEQQAAVGRYVEQAGEQVQRLSEFLQNTDVNEIVDRVESAARRQPALFLGGAFALGLIGARFIRSSRRQQGGSMAVGPYRGAQRESGSATPYAGAGFSGDRDVTALRETAREFSGGTRGTSSPLGASSAGTSSTGASSAGTSSAGMPPMGTSNPTGATPSQARPDTPSSPGFGTGSGRNANDLP